MKKIPFELIAELEMLRAKAQELYNEYDNKALELFEKYGESQHSHEMEQDDNGCKYIRLSIIDNNRKLKEGESVVGVSVIKPIVIEIKRLKREPK